MGATLLLQLVIALMLITYRIQYVHDSSTPIYTEHFSYITLHSHFTFENFNT